MDHSSRLKLILVGLILAGIAGGYFLYTQATRSSKTAQISDLSQTAALRVVSPTPSPSPSVLGTNSAPVPTTKGGQPLTQVKTLPATGAPDVMIALFSASAAIIGWGLRKYPN